MPVFYFGTKIEKASGSYYDYQYVGLTYTHDEKAVYVVSIDGKLYYTNK